MISSANLRVIRLASLFTAIMAVTLFFGSGINSPIPADAGPGGPGVGSHFQQSAVYRYCDSPLPISSLPTLCAEGAATETLAAGVPYDLTIKYDIPYGHMNASALVNFSPPDTVITPSLGPGSLPLGAVVGRLRSATTLGLTSQACSPLGQDTYALEVNFTFLNATTNTTNTLDSMSIANAGGEGAIEVFRDDINGNGLPDHVDFYPNFLNKVFDSDRNGDINGDLDELDTFSEVADATPGTAPFTGEAAVGLDLNADTDLADDTADLNGDGDVADVAIPENPGATAVDPYGTVDPLVPLARYSGTTTVAGTAVILQFVVLEPGSLSGFVSPHPFSDISAEMGYPTIVVLQDPNQALAPSAITDFCAPLSTYTLAYGTSKDNPCTPATAGGTNQPNDGAGCFNSNQQCAVGCGLNGYINDPLTYCTNEMDDDFPLDTFSNDGCPVIGGDECLFTVPCLAVADPDCVGSFDNDLDGVPNDGCPAVGGSEAAIALRTSAVGCSAVCEGGVVRIMNPPAGTGVHGSGTQISLNATASLRDNDNDGYENNLDTCKDSVNTEDPRLTSGADFDGIDPVCDLWPAVSALFNQDDDDVGPLNPTNTWANPQDNCPIFENDTQRQADGSLPRTRTAPNGGPAGDDTGDACEGAETGAACLNAVNDDPANDGRVNDGCPARGASGGAASAETGAACANAVDDDDANDDLDPVGTGDPDGWINDGCPAFDSALKAVIANGHFHAHMEIIAKCIGGLDTDGDGYCDALEIALGSLPGAVVDNLPFCESAQCGSAATIPGAGGAESGAQCGADAADSDGDGVVNDGCPIVGVKEANNLLPAGAQCQDAVDSDTIPDGAINDGCVTVGRGNCADGVDNDTDGTIDGLDAGCSTPEHEALDYPLPLGNLGSGADADNDGIPDHDDAEGAAGDDLTNVADGQMEEPHQVCNDDIDQDRDTFRDAFAILNNDTTAPFDGTVDGTAAEPDGADAGADPDCFGSLLDLDRDGVPNATDNCDGTGEADRFANFNPTQKNTGGAAAGDICDSDDDGDGSSDATERGCGSRVLQATSVCEVAGNGVDDDKDGEIDEATLLLLSNPTAQSILAGAAGDRWAFHDRDGDGYTLDQERSIGTEAAIFIGDIVDDDPCGGYLGLGADGWPSDPAGNNILNVADIGSFLAPNRPFDGHTGPTAVLSYNKFNHTLDDTAPFDGVSGIEAAMARWNLSLPPHTGTTAINIADLGALITGAAGSPAKPAMFGGKQAFITNGGQCPFAP